MISLRFINDATLVTVEESGQRFDNVDKTYLELEPVLQNDSEKILSFKDIICFLTVASDPTEILAKFL